MIEKRSMGHAMTAAFVFLVGCSDGGEETEDTGGGGGAAAASLKVIAEFDAEQSEFPEGIAVTADGKTAYVGFAFTGKVLKVSLDDGKATEFGSVPLTPMDCTALGLALDSGGALYVGLAVASPTSQCVTGVYKSPSAGGQATLFASDANLLVPNGLAFNDKGELLVTDTLAGSVFKVSPDGTTVTTWISDPLLVGEADGPCTVSPGLPLGANGITTTKNDAFVANYNGGSLVKIPILQDGAAGTPVKLAAGGASCAPLKGIDGVAADNDGSILAVTNGVNGLVRIQADGTATVLSADEKLDIPASVVIATMEGERWALLTNFAFNAAPAQGSPAPRPGVLAYGPLP